MKTTHLLSSLIVIVTVALSLGGIYPPAEEANALEPLQSPETAKMDTKPSEPAKLATRSEAKPDEPKLTDRQKLMQAAGIPAADWPIVEDVVNKESGWCATKWEGEIGYCPAYHGIPEYGGYGLCQSTPAHKMATMGKGWETDPVLQLKWCHAYAQNYGSWAKAKEFRDCLGTCYSTRTHNYQNKVTTWF